MKILSKPDVSNWSHKHKCTHCESELLVEESDLKYHYYEGDFRESSSESFSASCAVCNNSFSINTNSIPKLVKINVAKRSGRR